MTAPPEPPPPAPTAWDIEKAANRLQRMTEKVASGRWLPKLPYKLNGQAKQQMKEAYALLGEARDVITEAKR